METFRGFQIRNNRGFDSFYRSVRICANSLLGLKLYELSCSSLRPIHVGRNASNQTTTSYRNIYVGKEVFIFNIYKYIACNLAFSISIYF